MFMYNRFLDQLMYKFTSVVMFRFTANYDMQMKLKWFLPNTLTRKLTKVFKTV
jgi:hypothetical protein